MRKPITLLVSTALVSTMLTFAAAFSSADARIFLGQCISGQNACHRRCLLALNGQEANSSTLYGLKICLNNCDGGFSACLDLAFSSSAGKVDLSSGNGPSRNPPKRPGALEGGLLEPNQGFSPQSPAPTGSPVRPPPAGGLIR